MKYDVIITNGTILGADGQEQGDVAIRGETIAAVGPGLASGDGLIAGNRLAALPAPMSKLAWPLRAGMGPSGRTARFGVAGEAFAFAVAFALADLAGVAAVTAVVVAAAGGVHVAVVTTLAVTVSFTEVTEVAVDATAIWAFRLVGWVVTELTPHTAVPLPEAQPLLNVGFWLDGCAVSATDTSEADPFWVEIWTT